jgi:hypothetical protein
MKPRYGEILAGTRMLRHISASLLMNLGRTIAILELDIARAVHLFKVITVDSCRLSPNVQDPGHCYSICLIPRGFVKLPRLITIV